MGHFKPLSELTLKSNYMFAAVMREPKRIKPLLERILGVKIKKVNMIEPEKTFKERYESKGVRLDLYVEDEDGIIYDVEVQTSDESNLPQRMRYYQAMLDVTMFPVGADYNEMRKSFVIFICDFDPFFKNRVLYSFQNRCNQDKELLMADDAVKVVVNTKGDVTNIDPELKEFIDFIERGEITGPYSRDLDEAVEGVKQSEERRQEYMLLMTYGAEREAAGKYRTLAGQIRGWAEDNNGLSSTQIARVLKIDEKVLWNVASLIADHPDWDDETVANKAKWRE